MTPLVGFGITPWEKRSCLGDVVDAHSPDARYEAPDGGLSRAAKGKGKAKEPGAMELPPAPSTQYSPLIAIRFDR